TFVISEDRKSDQENSNTADKSSDKNAFKNVVFATCLFRFDSSVLIPSETDKILSILSKKKLKNSPLAVTGYTCSLGSNEHNQTLSLQRAKAVAMFLRKHGFTVATVQGKGSLNPVTNDPRLFRLNRRVTVQIDKQ
ncbi:MAG TPA: OmpA family protein, partial [Desulfobulbaceae bacterium]|nr:OmpA family protein [Desulfobulbaceae bacterium]